MESYIDFIKKYNNEKSISSTDSEFESFLKGGANEIKGGFPPIYKVNSESESFREFSPKVDVNDIFESKKNPFLNVENDDNKEVNGGFLNLFNSNTSIDLPDNLEVESIKSKINELSSDVSVTSLKEVNNIDVVSIEQNGGYLDNIFLKNVNSENKGYNITSDTIDLPSEIEIISLDSNDIEFIGGGDDKENDETSIELPTDLEVVDQGQSGGNIFIKSQNTTSYEEESSIDLPNNMEIINLTGGQTVEIDSETTIDLPDQLDIISVSLNGGGNIELTDSTIDLPNELEIVSIGQNGGFDDSSVDLPSELEVVSISHEDINSLQSGGNYDNLFLKNTSNEVQNERITNDINTTIDLPMEIEVIDVLHIGGDDSETTIELPELIEINNTN
jgi:hypothetical protein